MTDIKPQTVEMLNMSPIVEEIKEKQCNHPRHKTIKKGLVWQCRICGLIRTKGINSIQEENV